MSDLDRWAPLADGRIAQNYLPGQMIYLQDTDAKQFYYIKQGTVKCFISSECGDERTLALHHTGDLIGEAAFFDKQPRVSSAVAITRCSLVAIDRTWLEEVFAQHPNLAISLLEYLSRTVRLLSGHVNGFFLPADRRIVRYLLARATGISGEIISCTHEEIGSSVGVSRVTVSRVLGALSSRGLIRTGYRTITLLQVDALHIFLVHGDEMDGPLTQATYLPEN